MAQIIQIKRTAAAITTATANPVIDLESGPVGAKVQADNLAVGELFYADSEVTGTGTGVLYIGKDPGDGTPAAGVATVIGGAAFTSMLNPDEDDNTTVLTQSTGSAAGAASLTLADDSATGTVTLKAPQSASDTEIIIPDGAGTVAASSLLSLNSSSKVGASFGVAGKVTADTGFDANASGVANAGAVTGTTHVTRGVDVSHELMDGTDDTTDTNSRVGTKIQDAAGFFPGGTRTDDDTVWEAGDTFITSSPGVDIDIGYTGEMIAGDIAINATTGNITGSVISGGEVNAVDTQIDNQLNVGLNAEASIDELGNITTIGQIKSTYSGNNGHLLIDDGSITGALGVTSTGTVQGATLTDGVASLNSGALTGSTGVTLASGSVTAPVVKTTGTAKLDNNEVSGTTLALTGDAAIKGTLEVAGGLVQTSTSDVTIADSMVQVAADGFGQNTTNDLGWFGNTSRELTATDTSIIGTSRVIRVILSTNGNTYGFDHDTVIDEVHNDDADNAPPNGTAWAVGDAFVVGKANGTGSYPTTDNGGNWVATNKYLTYAGMAYDTLSGDFKLLQNDTKPGTNWDSGTSTKATLVADVTGDVTGALTGNADTASSADEATKLAASINIAATGDIAWNVDTDGSAGVTAEATIGDNKVEGKMLHPTTVTGDGTENSAAGYGLKQNASDHLEVDWKTDGLNDATVKSLISSEATSTISGATDTDIAVTPVDNDVLSMVVAGAPGSETYTWKNQTLADAGIQSIVPDSSTSVKGLMTTDQFDKLEGIGDATSETRGLALQPHYTAAIPNAVATDGANDPVEGLMSGPDKDRLDGMANNAIANITGETFASLSDITEPTVAQSGFKLTGTKVGTNPATYTWVEDDDNELQADSVDNTMIDWGSTGNQVDTDDIPEGTNKFYSTTLFETDLGNKTTNDLAEGEGGSPNLYFTEERVDDRVYSSTTVDNVTTETGLLRKGTTGTDATNPIVWGYNDGNNTLTPTVSLAPFDTSKLSEHASNLYYTNDRVDTQVGTLTNATATAGDIAIWDASANMDAAGITLGANGIIGDAGIAIKASTTDDTVVVTFGGAGTGITLSKTGIANTSTTQVMSLDNFTTDGGTLTGS